MGIKYRGGSNPSWGTKFVRTFKGGAANTPFSFAESRIKNCKKCGLVKSDDSFYEESRRPSLMSWCKECLNLSTHERQKSNKEKAVLLLGGKCQNCGYNRCIKALEFHHPDRSKKEKIKNGRLGSRGWKRYWEEVSKCILLCANCHREEEDKIFMAPSSNGKGDGLLNRIC